jgi:competence protein ComEA
MRRRRGWRATVLTLGLIAGVVGSPMRSAWGESPPDAAKADTGASSKAAPGQPSAPARLNLNTATVAELDGLPGVGRKRAEAIVARRAERPFQRVTELLRVKGFGPKLFGRVRPFVEVGGAPVP